MNYETIGAPGIPAFTGLVFAGAALGAITQLAMGIVNTAVITMLIGPAVLAAAFLGYAWRDRRHGSQRRPRGARLQLFPLLAGRSPPAS